MAQVKAGAAEVLSRIDWQRIETAPEHIKDGRVILAWEVGFSEYPQPVRWDPAVDGEGGWVNAGSLYSLHTPTHWAEFNAPDEED